MELTSEEIALLEKSREKEARLMGGLKILIYNRRIKRNEKKVSSLIKNEPCSYLDYRYALSLLDEKETEKQKNFVSLVSLDTESLSFFLEEDARKELRRKKILERKTLSPMRENAFRLRIAKKPFIDPEDDPIGYLQRYLLLRTQMALVLYAEKELGKMGSKKPSREQIEREADTLFASI